MPGKVSLASSARQTSAHGEGGHRLGRWREKCQAGFPKPQPCPLRVRADWGLEDTNWGLLLLKPPLPRSRPFTLLGKTAECSRESPGDTCLVPVHRPHGLFPERGSRLG